LPPYPITPRPTSQTPRAGPKYFPPNTLPEDDNMERALDLLDTIPDPPSPRTPRSPQTHPPLFHKPRSSSPGSRSLTTPEKTSLNKPQSSQNASGLADLPTGFLVHKVSEETMNLILNQRIWSTMDITFEALPFNCAHPPELLFCLSGFTTLDADAVWSQDEIRHQIEDCLSKCGLPDDELIYKAARDFIESARAELLHFKITGGLSVPRFNIFATSPTNDAKTWTNLRSLLHALKYPTGLDGCGSTTPLFPCQICHSLTHPRGLCPFPLVPLWNGPKSGNRNVASIPRGRPGRNA
ncbi:hypothetical protein DFJ58DRAFT_762353, partial [Suillus subalutaceus]|uniref:uncharacterized protein n=1 Tax=Suillus subalutaceus TaxID=48586 RepID=UPI001B872358